MDRECPVLRLNVLFLKLNVLFEGGVRSMSHERSVEDERRLKKLYNETKYYIGTGVWYDERKKRYIRYSPSHKSKLPKYLKRLSHRKVRKLNRLMQGNQDRRVFDYWWVLF